MKALFKLFSIVFVISFVSCQTELQDIRQTEILMDNQNVDYYSVIASLGYSIEGIMENDSLFLVSNMIVLRKEDLRRIADTP